MSDRSPDTQVCLLVRDFSFMHTVDTLLDRIRQSAIPFCQVLTVTAVSEPSRFDIFKEFEVTIVKLKGEVWTFISDLAHKLKTSDNHIWVGTDNRIAHIPFTSLDFTPLQEFSIGSYIHPQEFLAYYVNIERSGNALVRLEFDSKRLVLFFFGKGARLCQLELNLKTDLSQEIVVHIKENVVSIYLLYNLVPRLSEGNTLVLEGKTIPPDLEKIKGSPYEFHFDRVLPRFGILGGSNCIEITINKDQLDRILNGFLSSGFKIYFTSVNSTESKPVYNNTLLVHESGIESHGCLWAFQVLLSRGMHVCEQLKRVPNLKDKFRRLQEKSLLESCLNQIADILETGKPINIVKALDYYIDTDDIEKEEDIPESCYVKRILMTPTRHMYLPPQCMFKNRILRDYNPDFAVRVSFKDDNMQPLSNIQSKDFIKNAIESSLTEGFRLGTRHYQFLAASNSQLKSHSVWFYARDGEGRDAAFIRDNMGDLRSIRCVASYVARMGQCFSSTEDSIEVKMDSNTDVKTHQPDIKAGEYIFSDGTGRISNSLAKRVARSTGRQFVHSVYQIRYAGCKGTVSIDPTLEGDALYIRNSMCKFESDHKRLEIASVSEPCSLFLNHLAIMLLNDLGVPTDVFRELQNNMILELAGMLYDNEKAAEILGKCTRMAINFGQLVDSGYSIISDPLFREMLFAVMESKMSDIKNRARIELPSTHARNMIGAMDETATLKYGQVFIQYTNDIKRKRGPRTILEGDVIVTKFPALHQGDMRRFQAVDIPGLRHLVDCIVFPSQGKRPHPNEMAGSDLDGDQYFVTWLPSLLKDFPQKNCEPMDFPPLQKIILERDVEVSDIREFIISYIQNDRLGKIANVHKAHADHDDIFSPICQKLAKKHSEAVDFAKTGHCLELEKEERVKRYPDFMGKYGQNIVRRSDKALGYLFRESRKIVNMIPQNDGSIADGRLCEINKDLVENFGQKYVDNATTHLKRYRNKIQGIMNRFGIESEAEMLSGCIRRLHLRLSQRDEKYEVVQLVNKHVKALRQTYRAYFFEEFGVEKQHGFDNLYMEMLKKAATWYMVAYTSEEKTGRSFPWVVWDLLNKQCGYGDVENPVCEAISDTMPYPDEETYVVECIKIWATHENLPEDPLCRLYRLFSSNNFEYDDKGTVLVNFLKWAAIQNTDHPGIQIACLRAFFSLVCTADFNSLMGHRSDQYGELLLVVPTEYLKVLQILFNVFKSKCRDKYGSDITLNLRQDKKGYYPTGKLFLRAKHNDLDEMEAAFNGYFHGHSLHL